MKKEQIIKPVLVTVEPQAWRHWHTVYGSKLFDPEYDEDYIGWQEPCVLLPLEHYNTIISLAGRFHIDQAFNPVGGTFAQACSIVYDIIKVLARNKRNADKGHDKLLKLNKELLAFKKLVQGFPDFEEEKNEGEETGRWRFTLPNEIIVKIETAQKGKEASVSISSEYLIAEMMKLLKNAYSEHCTTKEKPASFISKGKKIYGSDTESGRNVYAYWFSHFLSGSQRHLKPTEVRHIIAVVFCLAGFPFHEADEELLSQDNYLEPYHEVYSRVNTYINNFSEQDNLSNILKYSKKK